MEIEMRICLYNIVVLFFFFKQKTAYEMRISDWSSDVCSSDLLARFARLDDEAGLHPQALADQMMVDRRRRQRGRDCDAFGRGHAVGQYQDVKIVRASCRDRVCQYV